MSNNNFFMIDWLIVKSYYYIENILKSCSITGKPFFWKALWEANRKRPPGHLVFSISMRMDNKRVYTWWLRNTAVKPCQCERDQQSVVGIVLSHYHQRAMSGPCCLGSVWNRGTSTYRSRFTFSIFSSRSGKRPTDRHWLSSSLLCASFP